MDLRLLDLLACPACRGALQCAATQAATDGRIERGELTCGGCSAAYPIRHGIPRFVPEDGYAASFGLQWNRFRTEQLDAANRFALSETRLFAETGWLRDWFAGRWVLDVGCGAGRFLDVASRAGAEVVGLDLSSSVDAARRTLGGRRNIHLVQASVYALPFRDEAFEGCYCLGVIQHTPDPLAALRALPRVLAPGGRLGLFIYERKPWTWLYSKYLIRPITRRLPPRLLLRLIQVMMPAAFLLTEVLFRVPGLGRLFRFVIPVSNYVGANVRTNGGLTLKQRYRWAIMDTFDMLAPRYDAPQREADVRRTLEAAGIEAVDRTARYGLCLGGREAAGLVRNIASEIPVSSARPDR